MILHVDMDAFFASVEVREQPALKGLPVVVGGTPQGRGVVAAASYEARRFGVKSAMPMSRALHLCPDIVRLPVNMSLYADVSASIHEIFARYTPEIEPLSLDEAFLDVSSSLRLFGSEEAIGKQIKQAILDEQKLVASVGIAPNKYLAKLASDIQKPDGFVIIQQHEVQTFLDPLPVSRLWGVGKATNAVFERFGIKTIRQVREQSPEFLADKFGKYGIQLWELAQGIDHRKVVNERQAKSMSNETTFSEDITDVTVLHAWIMQLSEQVAFRLRRKKIKGRTIQIKIRYNDFSTYTRAETLDKLTNSTRVISNGARSLLDLCIKKNNKPVRLIGVGVTNLAGKDGKVQEQNDLFASVNQEKENEIDQVTDQINQRFGKRSIHRGTGDQIKQK
ncbi:MAG: DNA polymerase IV [Gammaproteobacteria bacterium]